VDPKQREDNVISRADIDYDIPFKKQRQFLATINIELRNLGLHEKYINKRNKPALVREDP
jgi:hypothetical protein